MSGRAGHSEGMLVAMEELMTAERADRVPLFFRLLGYGAAVLGVLVLTSQLNDPGCEGCDYVAGFLLLLVLFVLGVLVVAIEVSLGRGAQREALPRRSDWDD